MTVACADCRSVFRVDPAKVPATGVRARCSVCGGVIAIAGGTLPIAVTPSSSRAIMPTFATAPSAARGAFAAAPTPAAVASRPFASANPTPVTSPAPPAAAPQPGAPLQASLAHPLPPRVSTTLMTPPAPGGISPLGLATGTRPADASVAPAPRSTAPPPAGGTPGGGKRSINPFLNADPGQRARRLARALVSDLVAYHPQKRDDGLRDGTLRQLFREEIKKSYEEYVEQVGRELAESSPHFQDALNEILGGGRKLF